MTDRTMDSERYWQNWDKGEAAQRIDEYWLKSEKPWRDMLAVEIKEELGKPDRLFEIGCGTGLIYEAMLRQGVVTPASYVGGDVSESMLSIARKRFPGASFVNLDIFNVDYIDKSCPTVICVHVLQHLPYYDKALSELLRITADRLYIVSWFNSTMEDELEFCVPSDRWDGQRFQNNCYSLPKFLSYILTHCDKPMASVRVANFGGQSHAITVTFGAYHGKRSFLSRVKTRYRNFIGA